MKRFGFLLLFGFVSGLTSAELVAAEYPPTDWGTDHVGKPVPDYVTGDECLFCHRKIGPTWPTNAHQLTVQPKSENDVGIAALQSMDGGKLLADQAQFLMNSGRITRFLKRSKEYGKLDLLNIAWLPDSPADTKKTDITIGRLISIDSNGNSNIPKRPHWQNNVFGERCVGCHMTAVEPESKSFSAISLDCFTCHGNVSLQHTEDVKKVLLSKTNREPRQVISICGQCHLRGGKSKSSGLPYPNSFIAGDNLFRDFEVDLSEAKLETLQPGEKHIFRNSRDVALLGSKITCLNCHDLHDQSTEKHQALNRSSACFDCHSDESGSLDLSNLFLKTRKPAGRSRVCDY